MRSFFLCSHLHTLFHFKVDLARSEWHQVLLRCLSAQVAYHQLAWLNLLTHPRSLVVFYSFWFVIKVHWVVGSVSHACTRVEEDRVRLGHYVFFVLYLFDVHHQSFCLLLPIVVWISTPDSIDVLYELNVWVGTRLQLEVFVVGSDCFVVARKEPIHVQNTVESSELNTKANNA